MNVESEVKAMTTIDTLMVEVAEMQILIPVLDIEYCFKDAERVNKNNSYISYKNSMVPVVSLREQFNYPPDTHNDTMVIIINKYDKRYAVTTDHIIGEHQAEIKPLGDLFANQSFFSGGSIMVDGKLALILDTNFFYNQLKH